MTRYDSADELRCAECHEPVTDLRFRDGALWTPAQVARFGSRKFGRVLCVTHYREAKEARIRLALEMES